MTYSQHEVLRAHHTWLTGVADAILDTNPKLSDAVKAHARELAHDMVEAGKEGVQRVE